MKISYQVPCTIRAAVIYITDETVFVDQAVEDHSAKHLGQLLMRDRKDFFLIVTWYVSWQA